VVTALSYLLVAAVVAAALFGIAVVVFGRGEELPPLPPRATPTRLPEGQLDGGHVRELRFPQAVRGYRMDDVDWVLERLADELDRVGAERDGLTARIAELESEPGPAVARIPEREAERTGGMGRIPEREAERTGGMERIQERDPERTGPPVRAEGAP
jgi:DivIVA domain-containing protein